MRYAGVVSGTSVVAALLFSGAGLLTGNAALAADVREGLYEITIRGEVAGVPLSEAPLVVRQCITQQSVQDLMKQMGGGGGCQVSDLEQSGAGIRFHLDCTSPMDVTGTGEAKLTGDEFNGRMDLTVSLAGGQGMPLVQSFSGKRVGDCE
jgi:hypothetical protein